MTTISRKYDKGEKRFKHQGRHSYPEIQFFRDDPKRFVGLCPAGMPVKVRENLLNEAIAAPIGDREIDYPKYLYVVHEGAIYEARTSDAGRSYHGFPYRGSLSKDLLDSLRKMAEEKNCLQGFEDWVKRHVLGRR
jgi:hypothetical protein